METLPEAFDLKKWVEENRDLLTPPTAAKTVLQNSKYMVTIVGGPNSRTDYHVNPGSEFFFQIEGDMTLRIQENGAPRDITIKEGEIFLLAPNTPHAPQRPAGTLGLILESKRLPDEIDVHEWHCEKCNHLLFEKPAHLEILERDMPPVFEAYYANPDNQNCSECGHVNPGRPSI